MTLEINPLSPALGAEVIGADLAGGLSPDAFEQIHAAWLKYQVVVLRDQNIDKEDQLRFARMVGPLEEVRTKKDNADEKQYILYVANRIVDGSKGALPDGEMYFHSDQCYYEVPCKATILNAMELPKAGGETLFASMYRAYEKLPEDLKKRIAGLTAVNMYDYSADPTKRNPNFNPEAPHFVHPVVTKHPETGRPVLYVNRQMTHHIVGMDPEESEALLLELFEHAENPDNVYEHVWRPHDLVMWDNRAVLHARKDFDPSEARVLRRVTVKGSRPVAA
jgi:taurine dioxygenase